MREGFRLALAFVRVPGLFYTLLIWPLAIGLGVALGQGALSVAYLKKVNTSTDDVTERIAEKENHLTWIRRIVSGQSEPFETTTICRWTDVLVQSGLGEDCSLEPHDLVIRSSAPEKHPIDEFQSNFNGVVPRIHICESCFSNFTIIPDEKRFDLFTFKALGLYFLKEENNIRDRKSYILDFLGEVEREEKLEGDIRLKLPALKDPIDLGKASDRAIFIVNIAGLEIGRAHV